MGSTMRVKSSFNLLIKFALLLLRAMSSSKPDKVTISDFISFINKFQAFLFAVLTSFLASFSNAINSSTPLTNLSELPFPSFNSKSRIHSRIFSIQSCSFSHFRRSIFLYLSCEPDVE